MRLVTARSYKGLETSRKFNPGKRVNPTWSVYKGKS